MIRLTLTPASVQLSEGENAACVGVGAVCMVLVAAALQAATGAFTGDDVSEEALGMVTGAMLGSYWLARRHIGAKHFVEGSEIVLTGEKLTIPGFVLRQPKDVSVTKAEIVSVILRKDMTELRSIRIRTAKLAEPIVIWDRAVSGELGALATGLQQLMGKKSSEEQQPYEIPQGLVTGVLALILAGIVLGGAHLMMSSPRR